MTEIIHEIRNIKKAYVSLDELESLIHSKSNENDHIEYSRLVPVIRQLMQDGIIKSVGKSNQTNGKIPSLPVKYKIIRERQEIPAAYLEEIKQLHPALNISGYMNNTNLYVKSRPIVLTLSSFLKQNSAALHEMMSKNERAYDIWGDEKALDDAKVKSVVAFNGFHERLNYYLTPEPFFDYIHRCDDVMNVLIIENKDTWFTIRRLLGAAPDRDVILGETIHVLLYGEGKKITAPHALEEYEREVLRKDCRFLYFGDLDFSGIDIFLTICKVNPGIRVRLFTGLYHEMLTRAGQKKLGQIRKKQNDQIPIPVFLQNFEKEDQNKIADMLARHEYIPQEILHYQILDGLLCRG